MNVPAEVRTGLLKMQSASHTIEMQERLYNDLHEPRMGRQMIAPGASPGENDAK